MILDYETSEWQMSSFEWLAQIVGGHHRFRLKKWVLPTEEYFSTQILSGEDSPQKIFERVKELAGLKKWKILAEEHDDHDPFGKAMDGIPHSRSKTNYPMGMISFDEESNQMILSYGRSISNIPGALVTVYIRELSRLFIWNKKRDTTPPSGWDSIEYLSDVASLYFGFDVFIAGGIAQLKRTSSQFTQGWEIEKVSASSKAEVSNAIALHLLLRNESEEIILNHVEKSCGELIKESMKSNWERFEERIIHFREASNKTPPSPC